MIWGGADVILIEIQCTISLMCLNHPETMPPNPSPWKSCLAWKQSPIPKRLGTLAVTKPEASRFPWSWVSCTCAEMLTLPISQWSRGSPVNGSVTWSYVRVTKIPWTGIRGAFFFDKAKFNYSLSSKLRNINAFHWHFLLLQATFKAVILTGMSLEWDEKECGYFLQVNQKFTPGSTAVLLFKSSRAHLSWSQWRTALGSYFPVFIRTRFKQIKMLFKSFWDPLAHNHFTWRTMLSRDLTLHGEYSMVPEVLFPCYHQRKALQVAITHETSRCSPRPWLKWALNVLETLT